MIKFKKEKVIQMTAKKKRKKMSYDNSSHTRDSGGNPTMIISALTTIVGTVTLLALLIGQTAAMAAIAATPGQQAFDRCLEIDLKTFEDLERQGECIRKITGQSDPDNLTGKDILTDMLINDPSIPLDATILGLMLLNQAENNTNTAQQ